MKLEQIRLCALSVLMQTQRQDGIKMCPCCGSNYSGEAKTCSSSECVARLIVIGTR